MYYNNKRDELKQLAKERIIETLENGYEDYLCDLHNTVFNEDYEYIYTSEAKAMLDEYDIFSAIEEVKEYEQSNFGVVNTDLSSPCDIANMIWYIVGEEALNELMEDSDICDELWNERLDDEERTQGVLEAFKERMER